MHSLIKSSFSFFFIFFLLLIPAHPLATDPQTIKLHPNKPVQEQSSGLRITLTKLSVDFIDVETVDRSGGYMTERIWGELLFEKGKESKKVSFTDTPFSFMVFGTPFSLTVITRQWVELKRDK